MSAGELKLSKASLQEFKYIEEIWNVQREILTKYQNINIAFYRLDDDNDGYLLINDFCVNLVNKGFPPEVIKYERLFHFIDSDQDGKIDIVDWNAGFQRTTVKLAEVKEKILKQSQKIKENKVKLLEKFGLSPEGKKGSSPPTLHKSHYEDHSDRNTSKSPQRRFLDSPATLSVTETNYALTDRLIKPESIMSPGFISNPATLKKEGSPNLTLDRSDKKELEAVGRILADALKPKAEVDDSKKIKTLTFQDPGQRSTRLIDFLKEQAEISDDRALSSQYREAQASIPGNFTFNQNSPGSKNMTMSRRTNTDKNTYSEKSETDSRSVSQGKILLQDREGSQLESQSRSPSQDRSLSQDRQNRERYNSTESYRTASEVSISAKSAYKTPVDDKTGRPMSFGQLDLNKITINPANKDEDNQNLEPIPSDRNIEVVYKESEYNLHIPDMQRAYYSENPSIRGSYGNEPLPRSASKPLTSLPNSHPSTEKNSPDREKSSEKSQSTTLLQLNPISPSRGDNSQMGERQGGELQESEKSEIISPRFSNTTEDKFYASKPPLPSKFNDSNSQSKVQRNMVDEGTTTEDLDVAINLLTQNSRAREDSGTKEERGTSSGKRELNQPTFMSPPERLVNTYEPSDQKMKSLISSPQSSQISPVRAYDQDHTAQQETGVTSNRNQFQIDIEEQAQSFSQLNTSKRKFPNIAARTSRPETPLNEVGNLSVTKQYTFGNAFNYLKHEQQTKSGKKKRSHERENFLNEEPQQEDERELWSMFRKKDEVKHIGYDQILSNFNRTSRRPTTVERKVNITQSLANSTISSKVDQKVKNHFSGLLNSLSCMSLKIEDEIPGRVSALPEEESFSDSSSIDLKSTLKKDMKGDQRAYLLSELTRLDFVNRQLKKVNDSLYDKLTNY